MAFVFLNTVQPFGKVAVNPNRVFAFSAEPQTPANDTLLLADGNIQTLVTEAVADVAMKMGPEFRLLTAASTTLDKVYINRVLVLHIVPHPQVPDVCLVHGEQRRIAVKGSLEKVAEALT